jgi:TonB family protein
MPEPGPPPRPAAQARPAPAQPRAPAFPAPRDYSFAQGLGGDADNPRAHGTRGIDTSVRPADRNAPGEVPRDLDAAEGVIRVRGAHVGKQWIEQLYEWWLKHSYYPEEAARRGEDGIVRIHVKVDRYGHVGLVEMESSSGSQWLDAGAQAVFRGATVPPFPLATPEPDADLDLTIEYTLIRR